jgi:hypothetical protein
MRLAAGLLGVSVIVLIAAIVSAVRVGDVAAAAPPSAVPDSALRFMPPGASVDIAAAVARDLFTDDRQAPARRYRLPGEADVTVRQASPRPVVLGTVVGADGSSFAMCQTGPTDVVKVRVGGKVGEYTVVSIERGRVTFRGADGERFTVDASKPAP